MSWNIRRYRIWPSYWMSLMIEFPEDRFIWSILEESPVTGTSPYVDFDADSEAMEPFLEKYPVIKLDS